MGLRRVDDPVAPQIGDTINGQIVTAEQIEDIEVDDWRVERFAPEGKHVAASLGLIGLGFGATLLISRLGGRTGNDDDE